MIFVSSALTMLPLFAVIGVFKFSTAVSTPRVIILSHVNRLPLALLWANFMEKLISVPKTYSPYFVIFLLLVLY